MILQHLRSGVGWFQVVRLVVRGFCPRLIFVEHRALSAAHQFAFEMTRASLIRRPATLRRANSQWSEACAIRSLLLPDNCVAVVPPCHVHQPISHVVYGTPVLNTTRVDEPLPYSPTVNPS